MDERIEAFLKGVLALEGEISNLLREGVRRQLIVRSNFATLNQTSA